MSRIEEISQASKKKIIEAAKNGVKNESSQITSDPSKFIIQDEQKLDEMLRKMAENKFEVKFLDESSIISEINQITSQYGYESLIYPEDLGIDIEAINASKKLCYDQQIETIRSEVFEYDFSVINALLGVSSHGVACVVSSKKQPRMLSLSPKLCIMLLKKESIVSSLSEALNAVKSKFADILPSNILFIAGPSRTADIELISVFGVDGPQKVHILVY